MADDTATNLVEADDTSELDTAGNEAGVEAEGHEPELDEDGNPIEVDEDEEVDLDDDLKLKVPKAAAAKLKELQEGNLRQADYTRKTQELAEERKAVQAERAAVQQASQAEIGALAQVTAIDQQLAEYQKVDWDRWHDEDPFEAGKAEGRYNRLVQARQHAYGQYAHLQAERTQQAQRETAKRLAEGQRTLEREIKGWSPAKALELIETAVKEYGFDRGEVDEDFGADPRMVKVLHDAALYRQSLKKTQKAQSHVAAQTAQPAAKVGKGASAPPTGLDDRLSAEEWARRRNKQLRSRG